MVSPREVQHIARLARIRLSEKEILQLQKDLVSILEYFEILRDIDPASADTLDTVSILPLASVSREDAVRAIESNDGTRLLEMAPEIKGGYVKVKSIL